MSGVAALLGLSLAGLLALWASLFWLIGRRPRRSRPRFWASGSRRKIEPVMSAAELEESFHRETQVHGKRG
jgi:hypothetical protein